MTKEDIIRSYDKAIGTDGSIAVLRGNLAPEGAVIKHTACPKEMFKSVLSARPFDSEEECLDAVQNWKPRAPTYKSGVLRMFSEHAASPMKGAYMEW